MKFGLIVNLSKPQAIRLANELCLWGEQRGNPFLLYPKAAAALGRESLPRERWLEEVETALVLGVTGDGMEEELIAPLWIKKKTVVRNEIAKLQLKRDSYQGKYYETGKH